MPARRLPRPVATALLAVTAALALTACGGSGSGGDADDPTLSSTPTTEAPAAGATATTAAASGGSSDARAADCKGDQVKADLTAQPGKPSAMLVVTNTTDSACNVAGWATLKVGDPSGAVNDVRFRNVEQPGPAEPVTLEPGRSAFAGIKWVACDKGSTSCLAGNSIQVGLPGGGTQYAELSGFPDPEKAGITWASVQVGTFQPSNQGVTAW
jgi:hypothetical protein